MAITRRPRASIVVAFALALAVAGCGAPPSPRAESSPSDALAAERAGLKRFTAAVRGFPQSVSTMIDAAGVGSTAGLREVQELLNAGLGITDSEGRLRPQLAEAVPSAENGLWRLLPDGRMETTWRLRPGIQWHDGAPFTADDLLFSAAVAQDQSLAIVLDSAFESIEAAEAPDAGTFVVRWRRPFIRADELFSSVAAGRSVLPMPKHLLERAYVEDRANFVAQVYFAEGFVGTGPFRLRELVRDSHLIVVANDHYALGRPRVDEIEVRFIGDFNVLVANVLAGAVEYNFGRGLSLEQALEARALWREGRMDTSLAAITALYPQFLNPSPAIVSDRRFRRALLHAIDRQQMTETLQAGLSPVAHGPLVPTEADAREVEGRVVRYEYDARQAVQLLESLGYQRAPDGDLRDPGGQRLAVKIQSTIDDLRQKMMPVIGDYWRQVGVDMEQVIVPRQLSQDRQVRAEFAAFDFTRQPGDVVRFHSSQTPLPENAYRGNNRTRYRSPELDSLIDRYLATIPRQERLRFLGDALHHLTDNLVVMGIFYIVEPTLITDRLLNVHERRSEEATHTWNAHEWELR